MLPRRGSTRRSSDPVVHHEGADAGSHTIHEETSMGGSSRRSIKAMECWMIGKPSLRGGSVGEYIPTDIQEQILSLSDAGTSFREISVMLGVKEAAVVHIIDQGTVLTRPCSAKRCGGCGAMIVQAPCLACITRRRIAK